MVHLASYNKHMNNSFNDRIASLNIEETMHMYITGKQKGDGGEIRISSYSSLNNIVDFI